MRLIGDYISERSRLNAEYNVLTGIVNYYGVEKQMRQLQEECAELIQAVNKHYRYPEKEEYATAIMEEICDVLICIDEIRLGLPDWGWNVLQDFREKKIDREINRIADKEGGKRGGI